MKLRFFAIFASAAAAGATYAATPLPPWYPGADTTRQGYLFTSSSPTPTPEIAGNPYGQPVASVTPGSFSTGWQDPAAEFDLAGVADDGAWDLGRAGTFTVFCKFAAAPPAPGTTFSVEFQVYSVAYLGITGLPTFNTNPLGLSAEDLQYSQTLVASDPLFPGATWQGQTWTGRFEGLTTNEVAFQLVSASNGSVIDTVEVFTHFTVIPEPTTWLLLGLASMGLLCNRRRS